MNAAFRSNFCYISLIRFGAPVIFLYKASLRDDRRPNSELHIVTKERNHTLRQEIWVQNVKLKIFRFSVFFRCLMTLFIFICVKRKKLCNCHSSFFFFFFLLLTTLSGQTGKSYFQSFVQLLLWARLTRIGVNNMVSRVLLTHVL